MDSQLSKLSILVAQLESILAASTHQQNPEPLFCFDLLVDLVASIDQEPRWSLVRCQKKCEEALQALLVLGVAPPVRRLAASATVHLIEKGDHISIYTRTSLLQGWLSDKMDRKSEPPACIGVAQCLGALLQAFGNKLTSGLVETSSIVAKLMRYSEVSVRQAALALLQDALEGSGGGGATAAYSESLRIIMRVGFHDRSALVRTAAAGCLRVFAVVGGPGMGVAGLESCCALCLKALEESAQTVRDAFAAALGALLALGLNPEVQASPPSGKGPSAPPKPIDGGLQRHLINPFVRASGPNFKEVRVSLTMALVAFLQGMRLNYLRSDVELVEFAMQAIGILASSRDTHAQACILFCLRVGIIEQMGESTQKQFADHLIKQLSASDINSAMLVVILRTLSHLLATLGEIPVTGHDALDNSLVTLLSNSSRVVRVEAALVLRTLAEVDATSANNLLSCGVTTLRALRETAAVEKGDRLRQELDSLHGQAAMLSAILTACPRLVLGVPSRLLAAVWDVAKAMVLQKAGNPFSVGAENEAGWMLIASIVSSMPKEEIEEQKIDILLLWTREFGEKIEERLKGPESMLLVHLNVWSAAVEALTAFVTNFVVPSMSAMDLALNEGILLQPLITYLSRTLASLSSNALQQAYAGLKSAIDLFTIRILRAFQAIPDPVTYQQDHSRLLSLCTAPFRDAASFGASSCLRQLLDSRDASLGPWIPGSDSFEDELRAFEGGADDLSPCIWGYEVSAFPQPLPVTTLLLDEMLLCFGTVFAAQTEKKKLQYIQIVSDAGRAGKRQSWHSANVTNTCVALLKALKASTGLRSASEVDAMKQLQEILQGILGDDEVSPAQRRAAAEGLGILARLGGDSYAVRLTRSLLTIARGPSPFPLKGSIALALGCIHQSVGGMALSALVPATVQTLCALAKDPTDVFPVWSLHGLWLTADAAGLAYVPQVQATLSLVMELLLSEKHDAPALGQSIGRLINAVVAVLGPELSPGSSLFTRCNAVVAEIGTGGEPVALLECVLFTQQLVLFAPRAVPVHAHVNTLRPTLTSRQPSLRQAAVSTLHHLSERDAVAMCEERIEQDLFAMLDKETDESIIEVVRLTLQRLFEASCPSLPSRWLHLCRNVVLSASTTKTAATAFEGGLNNSQSDTEGEMFGDDDQGMITENTPTGQPYGRHEDDLKSKGVDQLPRFKTRVFAAECLRRLPVVVGLDPTHFDLGRAKSLEAFGDWLVLHLGELVAVAYQVATGAMEIIRPMGIELLDVILEKFAETTDPMYEGHLLLEQYQAQLVSAARTALDPSASPLLVAAGSKLVARIITSGNAVGDFALIQRMVNLLTRQLLRWDDIVNPNFAEWVGCKVQVTLLGALACLKTHAFAWSKEGTKKSPDGKVISSLLTEHGATLGPYWVGLLRDFTALRLYRKTKLPVEYHPFLEGIQIVTIARTVEQYLSEVWLFVLDAVTVDARPTAVKSDEDDEEESNSTQGGIVLNVDDFHQVWALCMFILGNLEAKSMDRRPAVIRLPSHISMLATAAPESIALSSLRCLCSKGFYTPDMISRELCEELMHAISTPSLSEASAVLSVVDQIVKSCPQSYMESQEISLQVVELCLYHVFQTVTRTGTVSTPEVADKSLDVMSSALGTLGSLVGHFTTEVGDLLLPQLLSAGIKLLNSVSVEGSLATSTLDFMSSVTVVITNAGKLPSNGDTLDQTMRASLLAAAVESMAQLCIECVGQAEKGHDEPESIAKVSVWRVKNFLKVILDMVCSVPDVNNADGGNFRTGAQACCIDCLHSLLSSSDLQFQLAGLQSLESVVSGGSTKSSVGEGRLWAISLLREVGADVVQIVYSSIQKPLTTASAAAVAESLKLLILWHSIVEGDKAQQNVLHLLLPAMIGAATAKNEDDSLEGATQLRAAAVKLVTRLASVPSTAVQFKTVMLELQPESRQQLQTIIKASIQQTTIKTGPPPLAPLPLPLPKPLIPSTSDGVKPLFPLPKSTLQPAAVEIHNATENVTDEESEDDWDDFQGNTDEASESGPPMPEADKKAVSDATEANDDFQGNTDEASESGPPMLEADKKAVSDETEANDDFQGNTDEASESGHPMLEADKKAVSDATEANDDFQGNADEASESGPPMPEADKKTVSDATEANAATSEEMSSHSHSLPTEGDHDESGDWSTFDSGSAQTVSRKEEVEYAAMDDRNHESIVEIVPHQTSENKDPDMDPASSEDPLEWEEAVDDQNPKSAVDVTAQQTTQNTDQDMEPASAEDLSDTLEEMSEGKVLEADGFNTEASGTSIPTFESVNEEEDSTNTGSNMIDVTYSDDLRNEESTHQLQDHAAALGATDNKEISSEDAGPAESEIRPPL